MQTTAMVEGLRNPASFPDETKSVSVVQTHISVVFIGDRFVYKVKKPVNFGFLDFSTLEKRRYYCHKEVDLNRRLSKGIYLDVLPVRLDGERYRIEQGPGQVVDYAVKMKKIPEDCLMKSIFKRGELTGSHLSQVANTLAAFHLTAAKNAQIDHFGEPEKFKVNTDENFAQVERYVGMTIPRKVFKALLRWTDGFYGNNSTLFKRRIGQGKIRDCHGDLHMEHICFTKELSIIDCIEFNERFRFSDAVADLAFLLMDLEYHGGEGFSKILWDAYRSAAGEGDVSTLLNFYKVYRAFVRGKVNSFQVDDQGIAAEEREAARDRAGRYFQLAYRYIEG